MSSSINVISTQKKPTSQNEYNSENSKKENITDNEISFLSKNHFRMKTELEEPIKDLTTEFNAFCAPLLKSKLFKEGNKIDDKLYNQTKIIFQNAYKSTTGLISKYDEKSINPHFQLIKDRAEIFGNLSEKEIEEAIKYFGQLGDDTQVKLTDSGAKSFIRIGLGLTMITQLTKPDFNLDTYSVFSSNERSIVEKLSDSWILRASIAFESVLGSIFLDPRLNCCMDVNKIISENSKILTEIDLNGEKLTVTKQFETDCDRYTHLTIGNEVFSSGKKESIPRLIETLETITKSETDPDELKYLLQEMIAQEPQKMGTTLLFESELNRRLGVAGAIGFIASIPKVNRTSIEGGKGKPFIVTYTGSIKTMNQYAMMGGDSNYTKEFQFNLSYTIEYKPDIKSWFVNQPLFIGKSISSNIAEKIKYYLDNDTQPLFSSVLNTIAKEELSTESSEKIIKQIKRILERLSATFSNKINHKELYSATQTLLTHLQAQQPSISSSSSLNDRPDRIPQRDRKGRKPILVRGNDSVEEKGLFSQ